MNEHIKQEIKQARLYNYEIAHYLGISDQTLYRMLRRNLTSMQKEKILGAIKELQQRRYEKMRA